MIEAIHISKSFGNQQILHDVSFGFETGKTNLIIGRSGAGKTVLLKILVGLFSPNIGNVHYDGVDLWALTDKQLKNFRMKIGMLFQGNALFDSMTIEENVRFPMDMFTHDTIAEKQKRVEFCLERVDLVGHGKKFPSELSGGMQKRAGIARSIVLNPVYLFCDEPNSGLDPKTSITIDALITNITKDLQITTVINTHDMNSVMEIGDNICFIDKGVLAWSGSKEDIMQSKNENLIDFIFASPFLKKLKNHYV